MGQTQYAAKQNAQPHVSGQSNKPLTEPPHSLSNEQVLSELSSDLSKGLTSEEAARRLAEYGPNELDQEAGVQPLSIFIEQVFNAMTLVLLLALAASFGIQAWVEGGILGGVIVLNIVIGFVQTLQAEKTINSLKSLGNPAAQVFRDGKTIPVQTSEVVPGDIVDLSTGDSVPADIRLVSCVNLNTDEAMLTGESVPVAKDPHSTYPPVTGPGDRLNVIYSSTIITEGRGRGIVFAVGMCTEIGLIAGALSQKSSGFGGNRTWWMSVREKLGEFFGLTVGTPLQRKLAQLFLWLFGIAVACAIIVMGANKFNSRRDVVIYAVTTAVGTIPVSLLLVLTVTMAAGTKKMLARNVMVRNLSSLEALGGVTDICSDKTGTITQGTMVVRKAWVPGVGTYSVEPGNDVYNPTVGDVSLLQDEPRGADSTKAKKIAPNDELSAQPGLGLYLNAASLANLATLEQASGNSEDKGRWNARGAPTEIAIEVFAGRFGWNRLKLSEGPHAAWDKVAEFLFDSDVKKMSVIMKHKLSGEYSIFVKGAVERVLDNCVTLSTQASHTVKETLTEDGRHVILENMEVMASQGLRILAFATKSYDGIIPGQHGMEKENIISRADVENQLTFLGLIGIYDPPRPESPSSVLACQQAGITVHMLTGDHPQTARAIATEVAILPPLDKLQQYPTDVIDSMVMPASKFDALTDVEIDELPQLPLVVARCAPSTKVRMIDALHRRKKYTAMTGDGVNDSPSLKRSDIGIAMGTGSDVAKESSDIVLTDDNFASILSAIEEGRRIFDNIQKFILHVLAANLGFIIALLTGLVFKDSTGVSIFQLSPVQIIWMLMATGSFCETGLGFEKAVPDILARPPQNISYGVFTPEFYADVVVYGFLEAACILGTFTVVVFGFNGGNLGLNCNTAYSSECEPVFRARATCYATTTWVFLLFSWELIDTRRSFFDFENGVAEWAKHLWGNRFLFFSVVVVFLMVVPILYIPVLDHKVFMHHGITWEWAIVFIAVIAFLVGAELWKWAKRVYFRRKGARRDQNRKTIGRREWCSSNICGGRSC